MQLSRAVVLLTIVSAVAVPVDRADAQGWPAVFDPLQLLTLNLEMDNSDWQTIQNDETFLIEVPAMFWADGEDPILVAVRRKSALPLQNGTPFSKVSLKIDINELVPGQMWRDLRKLSLENGDDEDVVKEGFAWYLHRLASAPEGYGYNAGLASWVRLNINGVDTGVYVNAEQRDKRFLQNRAIWVAGQTWLYKVSDPNQAQLRFGGPADSPTFEALCYVPFAPQPTCPVPDDAIVVAELPALVDMQGILTLGAVTAFTAAPDAIFSAGKNFYYADFTFGLMRRHYPWDLDSVMGGAAVNNDVYGTGSSYASFLLGVPEFRAQYSQILNDLLCGPFVEAELVGFLDALEPVLTDALTADANSQIDETVSKHFDSIRSWTSQRLTAVAGQIEAFVPCDAGTCQGDVDGDGEVGIVDFLALLAAWGPNPGHPADLNGDDVVGITDFLLLLALWGPCPA